MAAASIRKELLDILACPACDEKSELRLTDGGLLCPNCGKTYPVENGIPIMLVEKAIGGQPEGK